MLLHVGYVGEPINYILCDFPLVELCHFSDFRVDIVENLFTDFSEFTFCRIYEAACRVVGKDNINSKIRKMTSNKVTQEGCKTLLDEVTEKEEAGKRLEEHFQGLSNAIKKKGCETKTGLKEGRLQIRKDYNKLLEKYRSIHVESE